MPISRGVTRKFARSLSRAFVRSTKNNIVPFFLERFPGASTAYSLRQLHPDAIFAIRVRRSSDEQEMDIGFTSTGLLDESALLLFVGSGDGFVVIWYDQSGNNNHASQSVASSQPKIVNAGTVIKENGQPAIESDGMDDEFVVQFASSVTQTFSLFTVHTGDAVNSLQSFYGLVNSLDHNNGLFYGRYGNWGERLPDNDKFFPSNPNEGLLTLLHTPFGYEEYRNGSNILNHIGTSALYNTFVLFRVAHMLSGYSQTKMQEFILYTSNQSANRSNIETNINNNYLIY